MSGQVQVCEIFVSIQGESTWVGMPCFFIRLAGCNLHCAYCDTRYAQTGGDSKTIASLVAQFRDSGMTLAEVTGGEPLIQSGTPSLLKKLQAVGTVLVETNGSRDISVIPGGVIAIVDFKCPSSGESEAMDWANIGKLRRQDEVKFVVRDRSDYDWAKQQIEAHQLSRRCHAVLISAVFKALKPAELAGWILQDRLPVRLNVQLHKIVWSPSARGV